MNRVIARISAVLLFFSLNFLVLPEVKAQTEGYIAIDLSGKLQQAFGVATLPKITSDSSGNVYFIYGGVFGKYNPSTGAFENLTPKLSALGEAWQQLPVYAIAFDPIHDVIYLGGFVFGAYDISTDTAVDLSDKIFSLSPDWEFASVDALTFDTVNGVVYLGGYLGVFARYNLATYVGGGPYPLPDKAYDLTNTLSFGFPTYNSNILDLAFDESHHVVFIGGDNSGYARYNTSSYASGDPYPDPDTAYYLSAIDFYAIHDFAFDPVDGGVLYLAGYGVSAESGYEELGFARYNTPTYTGGGQYSDADTAYSLIPRLVPLGVEPSQLQSLTLTFDSLNKDVYLGMGTSGIFRYRIPTDTATDFTSQISPFWSVPPSFTAQVISLAFEPRTASIYIGGSDGKFAKIAVPNNLPAGTDVTVQPTDVTTGAAPAILTFSTVTQTGTASLTTSSEGSAPPAGFNLGDPPTYYDLTTDAVFSGPITVCINYTNVSFTNEAALKLFHYENGAWTDRTVSLDTDGNVICANVDSLSSFAIFEPLPDADSDGVLDSEDSCPGTSSGAAVDAQGCSGAQLITQECPGPASFKNHGQYVSCVAHAADEAVAQGLITSQEKGRFVREAGHAK